jgi:hypothetical protein
MKIVFTTSGSDLNDPLDSRFGRAPKFLVYDLDSETFELVDNQQNLNAAQGTEIQSAETAGGSRRYIRGASLLLTHFWSTGACLSTLYSPLERLVTQKKRA